MKILFALLFFPLLISAQLTGEWHSSFTVAGSAIRISLHIEEDSSIFLSSPDDEFPKSKTDSVLISNGTIKFQWTKVGLAFNGEYYQEGDSIYGTMSQSGLKWPVNFTRELQALKSAFRYQEPQGELPYTVEELSIPNNDILLGATLTLPEKFDESTPIVILASGSGPQNRDCELMGHKPFLVIADYLARNGVGCLRFDDRGTGKSTGQFNGATINDFASDVLACFNYLTEDKGFSKNKIGLAGHSEGGMHTLIAAYEHEKIAFVIQLAAVGTTGREVLIEQQYLIPLKSGENEAYASWNRQVFEGVCDYVSKYEQKEAADSLQVYLAAMYEIAPEKYKESMSKVGFIVGMNSFINNAWAREFIAFETSEYLKGLRVPLLSINGEKDIQVPAKSNSEGFSSFKYPRKIKKKNLHVIAQGLNHLMQTCESCTIMEYAELDETFSEEVMKQMVGWIKRI